MTEHEGPAVPADGVPERHWKTRDELLQWSHPFPGWPALVIEDLTDEEGQAFLDTLREA